VLLADAIGSFEMRPEENFATRYRSLTRYCTIPMLHTFALESFLDRMTLSLRGGPGLCFSELLHVHSHTSAILADVGTNVIHLVDQDFRNLAVADPVSNAM
jgi:hypothetical protein